MKHAIIKLAYRQIIDAQSANSFEKYIFNASYNEFLLKSQAYNAEKKFSSFHEMVNNDGRANSLHYKLSFSVIGYVEALNKKIPKLTDNAGKNILFNEWQFELIDSDITNKAAHKVAINYYTNKITVIETLGEYMLLVADNRSESFDDISDSFILKMQDNLSITKFQQLPELLPVKLHLPDHNRKH
jgi:hypothetical protein